MRGPCAIALREQYVFRHGSLRCIVFAMGWGRLFGARSKLVRGHALRAPTAPILVHHAASGEAPTTTTITTDSTTLACMLLAALCV